MNLKTLKDVLRNSYVGAMVFVRKNSESEFCLDFISESVGNHFSPRKLKKEKSLKYILSQLVPERIFPSIYSGILEAQNSFISEFSIDSPKSNETSWFEIRSSQIHLKENKHEYLLILLTSVTEEKEKEFVIRRQKDEIERAAKMASLGEMAAGISHELNTPLNTIQSYVDMLNRSKHVDDMNTYKTIVEEASEKIEKTVEYITEVISGLRVLSKFKKDEVQSVFNIRELVESVVSILEIKMRHKGVKFHLEFQDDGLLQISGFPTQITQVLVNLVNNAVDAIADEPEKWIKMELGEEDNECYLRVIDSGHGLDPSLEAKIMTPFYTTKDTGTGLGLSLSKSVVLNHGGSIMINRDFPNTCFEVRIPTL